MTPKVKANYLVYKYISIENNGNNFDYNKQCALIAVNEIIDNMPYGFYSGLRPEYKISDNEYWQQVKTEIENL